VSNILQLTVANLGECNALCIFSARTPSETVAEQASVKSDFGLTLSLPTMPKIKIQNKSQISFCKILKNINSAM